MVDAESVLVTQIHAPASHLLGIYALEQIAHDEKISISRSGSLPSRQSYSSSATQQPSEFEIFQVALGQHVAFFLLAFVLENLLVAHHHSDAMMQVRPIRLIGKCIPEYQRSGETDRSNQPSTRPSVISSSVADVADKTCRSRRSAGLFP